MNNVSVKQERQSNFELLRILCMWGVLTNHVIQNLYNVHTTDFSFLNESKVLLMNFSIIAVNCFVLISGYFKIKASWRGLLRLYIQLFFYITIFTVAGYALGDGGIMSGFLRSVFSLSGSGMWYITAYFALFLISPMLNIAFENANKPEQKYMLGALVLIDVYVGYIHQAEEVTTNGYHLVHFITLYIIGRYISTTNVHKSNYWGGWISCVLLMTALHTVKMLFPPIAVIYSMRYNSPAVMVASVLFFLWVCKWKIKSKLINWVSASVLSVYIIHSQPVVSKYFFGFLKSISLVHSAFTAFLLILFSMFLLYVCSILLDKIRMIICSPIAERVAVSIKKLQTRLGMSSI